MRDYHLTGEVPNDTHDYGSTSRAIGHLLHGAAV